MNKIDPAVNNPLTKGYLTTKKTTQFEFSVGTKFSLDTLYIVTHHRDLYGELSTHTNKISFPEGNTNGPKDVWNTPTYTFSPGTRNITLYITDKMGQWGKANVFPITSLPTPDTAQAYYSYLTRTMSSNEMEEQKWKTATNQLYNAHLKQSK